MNRAGENTPDRDCQRLARPGTEPTDPLSDPFCFGETRREIDAWIDMDERKRSLITQTLWFLLALVASS